MADVRSLKRIYSEAKASYEAAKGSADAETLEQLHNAWKQAKRAYKKGKHMSGADDASGVSIHSVNPPTAVADGPDSSAETAQGQGDAKARKRKRKRKRKRQGAPSDAAEKNSTASGGEPTTATRLALAQEDAIATAFIGGISYDANEDDLHDFFSQCGTIKSIRMPRYQDSGKPRGYAHIDFADEESLGRALQLNNERLMGRYLEIKRANKRRSGADYVPSAKPAGCRTVFVKNLPYDTSEEEVHKAFQFCGKIAEVRLARWGHTQQLKGIGYVQFLKEESATIAVKKRGTITVGGRNVVVDYEGGAPKASFRTSDRQQWSKVARASSKRRKRTGPRL